MNMQDAILSIPNNNFKNHWFDLCLMLIRLSLPCFFCRRNETGAKLVFSSTDVNEFVDLEVFIYLVTDDKFVVVGKINFEKKINVSLQQQINRIPVLEYTRAICRLSFGEWWETLATNCVSQTFTDVKTTVTSSKTTGIWFQIQYSLLSVFAVSTQFIQLFSSSNKKKSLVFTMSIFDENVVIFAPQLPPWKKLSNFFVGDLTAPKLTFNLAIQKKPIGEEAKTLVGSRSYHNTTSGSSPPPVSLSPFYTTGA